MGSIDDAPQMMYPAPLDASRGAPLNNETASGTSSSIIDIETPILIVGGGPVGMMQAMMLSRLHSQRCMLIEREPETTIYPKMEFTNGHTMEFYRAMGLSEDLRAFATQEVPEHHTNDELNLTSLAEGGRVVHVWEHEGAQEQREHSRRVNDGSQYLEPHLRCHQILIERWLKERVQADERIESHWGVSFVGLEEREDGVVSEAKRTSDGATLRIKSQYVIGCDGGGSWVRKSVGLESKRTYLEMTLAFVHFRSAALRKSVAARFQRFWHANTIGGGILVTQNEDDLWTIHLMVPPGVDPTAIPTEEIIALTVGGCQGPVPVAADEVYCRGVWKVEVAIADRFRSSAHTGGSGGRVFLAGDAAHQLSPVGGHGLNSGISDAVDLAWKLNAVMAGWGGERLLESYDAERRQIAHENLSYVQQALEEIAFPVFMSHLKYGAEKLFGEGDESDQARAEVKKYCQENSWLHNQNGNILGYYYKDSDVLVADRDANAQPPKHDHVVYTPSTWPGARAPHVWMDKGGSTVDELNRTGYSAVDFSEDGALSAPFVAAAEELHLPVKVLRWHGEENVRKVYERDLVLVRPDGHVAWRGAKEGGAVGDDEARSVLRKISGRDSL